MKRYFVFSLVLFIFLLGFAFLVPHVKAQTLAAPTGLTASNTTTTGFDVSWTAPTTALTITGYDVQYRQGTTGDFSDAGHTGTDTTFTFTGLTQNTAYQVQVRAIAGAETGVWSTSLNNTTLPTLAAPTGLTASNTTTSGFAISWTAPTTTLTITGYDVQYRAGGTNTFSDAGHTGTGTTFTFTGLTPNTSYEVQVRAIAGTETGAWSASLNNKTFVLLTAPTNLTTANITTTGFDVSWAAPSTTLTITSYDVQYRAGPTSTFSDAGHTGTDTTFTFTGLTSNTSYEVRVRAIAGTETGAWSDSLYKATLAEAAGKPEPPTGVTVSDITSTSLKVSWTAPTGNISASSYTVLYMGLGLSSTTYTAVQTTNTSVTLSSLTPSTTYNIYVYARAGNYASTLVNVTGTTLANNAPTGSQIPKQAVKTNATATVDLSSYFSDADGDTLTYTATSSDTAKATVSVSSATLTITGVAVGTASITATATDPDGLTANQTFSAIVSLPNAPVPVGTISDQTLAVNSTAVTIDVASYFSDPNNDTLTYTAASSDTSIATVSMSSSTLTLQVIAVGTATITVTATDPGSLTANQTFSASSITSPSTADVVPGLSSVELLQLGGLLTYDTVIFNELYNGANDANDWLELRNVSISNLVLDDWQLTIRTGEGSVTVGFPVGTAIPAGGVLLLTNTEWATADTSVLSVVAETFTLPQSDFALILQSPTAFGDIAGNYFQGVEERPETAPAFTVGTVWARTQPIISGYRAKAWTESTDQNGLGTPGYHRSLNADLNNDGVVNILDLVLVASQFGMTGNTAADLNGDGVVNISDLVLVAGALGNVAGAPSAQQFTAVVVNHWLRLARENASQFASASIPEGFSYTRGVAVLEQLARALTPNKTALLANYPNPFNPETWIPYQLSKAADVTVTIYASDGSVVRTLAIGHRDVGMYKTRSQAAYWDGKNEMGESVASGVYFYTLTAGDFDATRKMLILK